MAIKTIFSQTVMKMGGIGLEPTASCVSSPDSF